MASHRRGDGQSRPAPGTPRHLGPVAAGGGDREQSATTNGTAGGLDAEADFALDYGLAQGPYSYGEDFVYSSIVPSFRWCH